MSTDETKKPRKRMRYIVTLDDVPCARVVEKRFGRDLAPLRGILVANKDNPEVFRGERSANRAIKFTLRVRKTLGDSICEMPEPIKAYLAGSVFAVKEHGRS